MLTFKKYKLLKENLIKKNIYSNGNNLWKVVIEIPDHNILQNIAIECVNKIIDKIPVANKGAIDDGMYLVQSKSGTQNQLTHAWYNIHILINDNNIDVVNNAYRAVCGLLISEEGRYQHVGTFENGIFNAIKYSEKAGLSTEEINKIIQKNINQYIIKKYGEEFKQDYKTSTVVNLVNNIIRNPEETNTLAILADALQDAGLENERLLKALQANSKMVELWIRVNL